MIKNYNQFIKENYTDQKTKFIVDEKNNKFKLFVDDVLVAYSGFNIEKPDEWFNEKYLTLFNVKTIKKFQGKGFMKYLLEQIFDYVKNEMGITIISLLVYKNNYKAVNLYFKCGFVSLVDHDDEDSEKSYYSLIKKL